MEGDKRKKRHIDLSNTSFASPCCLLHYYILCKHCHLVAASPVYLFIFFILGGMFGGGGWGGDWLVGCINASHLDIYNWVVFGKWHNTFERTSRVADWNIWK